MTERCDAQMRAACMRRCDAECHGTGRYGTERKSHQDPAENRPVLDAAGPVDNRSTPEPMSCSDDTHLLTRKQARPMNSHPVSRTGSVIPASSPQNPTWSKSCRSFNTILRVKG